MSLFWILDALLAVGAITAAGLALFHPRIFAGVMLFIVFGVLLALVWLRLRAPDVALTEAAVGAGITGILLMVTLARLAGPAGSGPDTGEPEEGGDG
ncbi:MAG: Na(+)/H(+) antiporter subunit B [Alphaproteobacteria bacterium]